MLLSTYLIHSPYVVLSQWLVHSMSTELYISSIHSGMLLLSAFSIHSLTHVTFFELDSFQSAVTILGSDSLCHIDTFLYYDSLHMCRYSPSLWFIRAQCYYSLPLIHSLGLLLSMAKIHSLYSILFLYMIHSFEMILSFTRDSLIQNVTFVIFGSLFYYDTFRTSWFILGKWYSPKMWLISTNIVCDPLYDI